MSELRHCEYDFVLLLEELEHAPVPSKLFSGLTELVRPRGYVLITTPALANFVGATCRRTAATTPPPATSACSRPGAMHALLARHGFAPVHFATDPAGQTARAAALAPLYDLDFRSPCHDEDASDLLYRPTALGRLIGRSEGRQAWLGSCAAGGLARGPRDCAPGAAD
jgi:hypothetical protein